MKYIELVFLRSVYGPKFAAIQKGAQDAGAVNLDLSVF